MLKSTSQHIVILTLAFLTTTPAPSQRPLPEHWVGSWAASQQIPEPQNALPFDDLRDTTLRQIVHLTLGGSELRVRFSNAFGTAPLHIAAAHIAHPISPAGSAIDPATDTPLTFSGSPDVIIPPGAEYISDRVNYRASPSSSLAITVYFDTPPGRETSHPGSRATSYYSKGSSVSAPDLPDAHHVDHWYHLSGVEVATPPQAAAIVTLGDSITDGHGATTNGDNRWPDILAARLQTNPKTNTFSVLNVGTGGNRLLLDGLGPNALARFNRDVLAQAGASYVIVLEGVNDLGTSTRAAEISQPDHDALVHRMITAYTQMIESAHAHNLKILGATITPYGASGYYHPSPQSEADRQAINQWIRTPGHFDAIIDFDQLLCDPAHPAKLLPLYDSGDGLHPSVAGYKAMGDAIPLTLFIPQSPSK
jgi:lysophospholipase L1-like esterase